MYKVIVTADGTSATASRRCLTRAKAESVKAKLSQMLKMPVQIDIVRIGKPQ